MANISQIELPSGDTFDIVDQKSGYITGMTILSYGSSTWQNFIDAYNANKVVYCRASSNANPATGSQTRLAFMAYVNNATTPTNVEFQYYRSVSSHSASQQGDQVFVYKLDKTAGWTVTTREASVKININSNNEGIKTTYSSGTVSIGHANSVTAQTTQAVYPIAYDAQGHITSSGTAVTIPTQASDIGAQPALVSGTNIKTINNNSLLGSGNITIEGGTNGITDVQVNGTSVVDDGVAEITIPTNISSFTNDSGYLTSYTETDPTVPSWAKESSKPSYTFSEINSTPTTINGYGITDGYTKTEVDNLLSALPEPMLFKGSLGTGGTITTLPSAATSNEGFVYKVIEDGTYASQAAKVGDTFISDGSNWVLIPSGDEPSGTVTSVGLSNATNGGLSISGSPVTSSGTITVGHSNVLNNAQTTSGIYPIKIDKNGHISEYGSAVTIPDISGKQDTLVSGTNIKTINNESLLGSGNISISSGSNYTAGDGIDITSNVISVDSNLTVSGDTAYLDYAKPQGLTSFGKNLNPFPYEMTPASTLPNPNGNFRYDIENGIIILNGYASTAPNYLLHNRDGFKLPVGTYILSDGWSNSRNWGGLYLSLKDSSDTVIQQDLATTWYGQSQFTITEELYEQYDHIQLGIYINSGNTYSNITVYPMIRYAQISSDLWDPYRQVIPQEQLVSGINIKTVNNSNILGSGNLSVGTVKGVRVNNSSVVNNSDIANINLVLRKYQNTYTTIDSSTSTVSIGIADYSSTDMLLVDVNGLLLALNEDYTINSTNKTVTFATPLTGIGETVHFTVIRLESN